MARNDTCIFALSVDPNELKRKLLSSLHEHYTPEQIKEKHFIVVCQGFDEDVFDELVKENPEIHFLAHDKVPLPISNVRKVLTEEYEIFETYDYVVFIDDDFKYGPAAFRQYDYFLKVMDEHPEIGFVAMHRRIKTADRQKISPLEYPYPHDLGAVSMRNGLLVRSSAVPSEGLFCPDIAYHEEMYMAAQIYLNGYQVAKGWMDIFHQSNKAGLGCKLQKEYDISRSNEVMSSKRKLFEQGLFEIEDGRPFYDGQDCGQLNTRAHQIHELSAKMRGFL